jgi:hypothetical protein
LSRLPRQILKAQRIVTLVVLFLLTACGGRPEQETVEVRSADVKTDGAAVERVLPLVLPSHQPNLQDLPPPLQILFTYLDKTPPARLVRTEPHAEGSWRIEKIFLLDDCVAVQLTEGHYLETLFFVQYSQGWRLTARIRPQDHI